MRSPIPLIVLNIWSQPSLLQRGGHAMNIRAGLRLYIRPLLWTQRCPGLDEICARSPHEHHGLVGPTICPGSERAGCPCGVITMVHAALLGVTPCVIRLVSSRGNWFGRP